MVNGTSIRGKDPDLVNEFERMGSNPGSESNYTVWRMCKKKNTFYYTQRSVYSETRVSI